MDTFYSQSFKNYVDQYTKLDQNDLCALLDIFVLRKYRCGEDIVAPTDYNNSTFFVFSGLVRYYYLTGDGKEWNRAFLSENMMSTSFSDDADRIEPYGIQALEDTAVLFSTFFSFQELFDDHPMIERLHRKLIENVLILKMNRERSFLQSNAKMRYLDFIKQYPNVFQRITQYHLASYLGITEASLSRIVREVG